MNDSLRGKNLLFSMQNKEINTIPSPRFSTSLHEPRTQCPEAQSVSFAFVSKVPFPVPQKEIRKRVLLQPVVIISYQVKKY